MRCARGCLAAGSGIALLASVLAMPAAGVSVAFAQVTGKVIGTVTDRDTGGPLVGGQILVEGTNLGNVTNEDGSYFINNVAVGMQSFTAQYLGYESATIQQLVLAGQTMTVDFALSSSVVQAASIVVRIEREPLVIRDNMISKSRFTAEEARNLPVRNIESVIELGAGIYQDRANCGIAGARDAGFLRTGCGFIIRGGRTTESATYVDGALMTDFSSQTNLTGISNFAIEEVDVITGGFNAEFGHAQSGIINIVTREGDGELHGSLRFTTDELSDAIGQSFGYNDLQLSLGGPILTDRLMAYGSFEATGAADFFPAAAGFNPAVGDQLDNSGSTKELLPGNRGDRTQAQAKLTAFLPFAAKLTGTYLYSRDQFESHQPSRGIQQFTSGTATRTKTLGLILGYDQQFFQTGERNLNLQVRGSYQRSEFFQGTPLTRAMSEVFEEDFQGECGAACVAETDAFDEDFLNYRIGDVEFFFEDSTVNSVFGTPRSGKENPDPVFGQPNVFFTGDGFFSNFRKQSESRYGVRLDLDSQLDRVHRAKLGVEWNWIGITHGGGVFDGDALADVYDVDPMVGAAYVQDRMDFGDLVIDVGLRWDRWNPNAVFPLLPGLVDCSIVVLADAQCREAEVRDATQRSEWSPRFGVAHPITDVTQVRLSYGKFYQLPQLQHFFSSYLTDEKAGGVMGAGVNYGNPDLDFVETTAFEAGITHQVGQDFVIDLVAYNRDRRGAVRVETFGSRVIDPLVVERRIFVNGDNGNVKGLDVTLTRRLTNYWSMDLSWSLQWARGTTSSPLDWAAGFGDLFTPGEEGGVAPPPTQLQPEDFDRLHNLDLQMSLQLPADIRAGTHWGAVFRNFDVFLTYIAQSGTPYTRTDAENRAVEDFGESRQPWFQSGDIRIAKGFDVGGLDLSVFGLVENFLGTRNVIVVNSGTGLPNLAGTEFVDSRNPRIAEGFLVERVVREFPIALVEILPEWRDEFSRQDLDGDGLITLEESQETALRAHVAWTNLPLNYGSPRQIRFGAEIRF